MTGTAVAIKGFKKTLEEHCTRREDTDVKKIISDIEKVNTHVPAAYSEKSISEFLRKRAKILRGLVEEYFITAISKEFPLISEDLFNLKRYLTISGSGRKWEILSDDIDGEANLNKFKIKKPRIVKKVKVPLFAYTPLFNGEHKAVLGKISSKAGYYRTNIKIQATLPGIIGPTLKKAYAGALSHYFKTLSDISTNPIISDMIYPGGKVINSEVGAIWIPTPESLNLSVTQKLIQPRKNLDPAMILSVGKRKYLVKTWQVDDEESSEQYLREFSVGDLKGKL